MTQLQRGRLRARARAMVLAAAMGAVPASHALAADWSQAYIGAGLGADAIGGKGGVSENGVDVISAEGVGGGDLGLSIRAGADYQLSSMFVVGLVGIYDWSNIETSASYDISNNFFGSEFRENGSAQLVKLDKSWTIAARAGLLLTPELLAFVLAGYARVSFDDMSYTTPDGSGRLSISSYDALVLGGGLEYRISSNLSVMAEYRHAGLGRRDIYTDTFGNGDTVSVWTDPVMHWARIGAAYRFGGIAKDEAPLADPVASNWTGLYGGAGIGLDAATRDLAGSQTEETFFGSGTRSAELKGLGGGGLGLTVTLGYDQRIGNFVAGAFVDYDWSNQQITATAQAGGERLSADFLSLDQSWTIGARLGFLAAEDVLVYGLLGYTRLEFNDAKVSGGGQSVTFGMPQFSGITAGGGFEKLLANNLSLRLEYRYTSLGDERLFEDLVSQDFVVTMDPSMHMARAMLTYRFSAAN